MKYAMMCCNSESAFISEMIERRENARRKYWNATKYPRKIKKKIRKEALIEFELYSILSKPLTYFIDNKC